MISRRKIGWLQGLGTYRADFRKPPRPERRRGEALGRQRTAGAVAGKGVVALRSRIPDSHILHLRGCDPQPRLPQVSRAASSPFLSP